MPNKNYQVMNYDTLTQQIIDYSNMNGIVINDQFTLAIPYFIFQAQARIWREAKDIGFERQSEISNFVMGDNFVLKPSNWNKTISIIYGTLESPIINSTILELRTYETCVAYWPNSNQKDKPLFYADACFPDVDNNSNNPYVGYWVVPTPDQNYSYQINYLCRPVNITEATQTNILTNRFPDLLFYACMAETIPYLIDDERIPVFEQMYQRALKSVNDQTIERYTDRTSKRDKD